MMSTFVCRDLNSYSVYVYLFEIPTKETSRKCLNDNGPGLIFNWSFPACVIIGLNEIKLAFADIYVFVSKVENDFFELFEHFFVFSHFDPFFIPLMFRIFDFFIHGVLRLLEFLMFGQWRFLYS